MLDKNTLSQLSQLKAEIKASKEYATGTVASTSGRFGFVRLEDGRDAFLSPEKMQHVLPGDKLKVSLTKNEKDQLEASFEALLESPLKRFIGKYQVKGAGHFIVPQAAHINRWIFVPPKNRSGSRENELVVAEVIRHPYKDGKAQANVVERIGFPDENYIEYKYTLAEYGLNRKPGKQQKQQTQTIVEQFAREEFGAREDLTHLPFVTIDSASTRDMDDALAVERTPDGITLHVAIADPASFIQPNSPLAKSAEQNGQSCYFLGGILPMLPDELANDCFSLVEGKNRPAIVCHIQFDKNANISGYGFVRALIQSRHKLSYVGVSSLLDGSSETRDELPEDIKNMLQLLGDWANQRLKYREENCILGHEQDDYDIRLDNRGKIEKITARNRGIAHRIVEEAMLAANLCAGQFLQEHGRGIYTVHNGFREDRLGEVRALLKEEQVETGVDLNEVNEHLRLLKSLESQPDKKELLSPLRRMMQTSSLSLQPGPHLGMGLPHYATITSPIRRFADLFNHWAILSIIENQPSVKFPQAALENLQEVLQHCRQADRALYQWLICQYTLGLIGYQGKGKVRIVTQQGFGVRLNEFGIDGFVLFPKKKEKKYDAKRMTLEVDSVVYKLDTEVEVKVSSVDMNKRRIAFAPAGEIKEHKEEKAEAGS